MEREEILIEVARTLRELTERVERRIRDQQTGDAWKHIPCGVVDLRKLPVAA